MVSWIGNKRYGPIGLDLGSRSVKLVQFYADHSRLVDMARWELPRPIDPERPPEELARQTSDMVRRAMEGRQFRGRQVVACLNQRELFLQNVRVPANHSDGLERLVQQEAAARLPYSIAEAEIRYVDAANIQQGEHAMREVILFAAHRPRIDSMLHIVEDASLQPVAVDVEPAALLRGYVCQFRREEDHQRRTLFVHIGYSKTIVIIAEGEDALFIKYIDVGGQHMDQAVSKHLQMELPDAVRLRRHNGDRRAEQQDAEIAKGVADAVRPVVERLTVELSRCIRYHSVTFRGQSLVRAVLGGGEASTALAQKLTKSLDLTCHLSDPLRKFLPAEQVGRGGQWDVAAGLALRNMD